MGRRLQLRPHSRHPGFRHSRGAVALLQTGGAKLGALLPVGHPPSPPPHEGALHARRSKLGARPRRTPPPDGSPNPLPGFASPQVLAARVSAEAVWDQSAYNQEIFRLAHGGQRAPGVSVRTMNYMCFLNTKFLFRYMRKDPQLIDRGSHVPVSCHVNYRALPAPRPSAQYDSCPPTYRPYPPIGQTPKRRPGCSRLKPST